MSQGQDQVVQLVIAVGPVVVTGAVSLATAKFIFIVIGIAIAAGIFFSCSLKSASRSLQTTPTHL